MSSSNFIHLERVGVKRVTDWAAQITYGGVDYWIPKSQMASGEADKLEAGDEDITLSITAWIAEQKGIDT